MEPLAPQSGRTTIGNQLASHNDVQPLLDSGVVRVGARDLDDTNDAESMAIDNDDDAASEQEDVPAERELSVAQMAREVRESRERVDSSADTIGHDASMAQQEDSDPELDLLVESESDSDDNHSNQDAASAQRSTQTGATAGSDTGMNESMLLIFTATNTIIQISFCRLLKRLLY